MIVSEQPLPEQALRDAIAATGYQVLSVQSEPYEKKRAFSAVSGECAFRPRCSRADRCGGLRGFFRIGGMPCI